MNARVRRELPFEYPGEPPDWLGQWPDSKAVRAMFSDGVRRLTPRVIRQGPPRSVRWTPNALNMEVGSQRPYWRLLNGRWTTGCSCGYPGGKCPHVLAAAEILRQILRREEWRQETDSLLEVSRPNLDDFRSRARPRQEVTYQGDLFEAAREQSRSGPQQLQVEVDLNCEVGKVGIRFYRFANNRRSLLRMQQLHNLGITTRHRSELQDGWNQDDRRFLGWLAANVLKRPALVHNPAVLKIPRGKFEHWQQKWVDCPDRFIERLTQRPLRPGGGTTAARIELNEVEGGIEIALFVTTPSGQRLHFHELASQLAGGSGQFMLEGRPFTVDFPVSRDLLVDVFSRRSPVVPPDKICDNLPTLVQGRLDLVGGNAVIRKEKAMPVALHARDDGGDILFTVKIGKTKSSPQATQLPASISRQGRKFVITTLTSPHLGEIRDFLENLGAVADGDDVSRLSGRTESVAAFVSRWGELSPEIDRTAGPRLKSLLGGGDVLRPLITGTKAGNFVDLTVTWIDADGNPALSAREMADAGRRQSDIVRTRDGHWLKLDLAGMSDETEALTRYGFDRSGNSRMLLPEAGRLFRTASTSPDWLLAPDTRDIAQRVLRRCDVAAPQLSFSLNSILRHYQREGFEFLVDRAVHQVGAILADDMGLGKTLQILSVLAAFADQRGGRLAGDGECGALVVCPASVVGVWLSEVEKFCPELRCRSYAGLSDQRRELLTREAESWDLLIVNYALLRNDIEEFLRHEFAFVVLDEAQQIKNPDALITQAVKRLRTKRPLALTGTPVENRVSDLWSIMDFLNPGFLGELDDFKLSYSTPEEHGELSRRIAPVVLRRTKELVAPELPAKTEELIRVEMDDDQRSFYTRQLAAARAAAAGGGTMALFAALTRMRQICCDPRLIESDIRADAGSAKLDVLIEMTEEILDEGHSVLVFSQFTGMLALIEERLRSLDLPHRKITGSTPTAKRNEIVASFSSSPVPEVFLLSLRAAGTGLTLTKADYVFLYDPWWNPAVENQAIDRTHRIGQDKPVFAYRLIVAGSVEEKVMALQQEKAELFSQIMADSVERSVPQGLTHEDLQQLLG